jgi:hypothetical protein
MARNLKQKDLEHHSPLMRVSYRKILPPTMLFPATDEEVKGSDLKKGLEFKWIAGSGPAKEYVLEISDEPSFKKPILITKVENQTFYQWATPPKAGQFYWRLNQQGTVNRFSIQERGHLSSPVMASPRESESFSVDTRLPSLEVRWGGVADAKSYEIKIKDPSGKEETQITQTTTLTLKNLEKGTWLLSLVAKGIDGLASPLRTVTFQVKSIQKLSWLQRAADFTYVEQFPSIPIGWNKLKDATYRLKVSDREDLTGGDEINLSENSYSYRPVRDGNFFFQVEAKDVSGTVLAKTDVMKITGSKILAPPTPDWNNEEDLQANGSGEITVSVKNYPPGALLWVEVKTLSNQVVEERKSRSGTSVLDGLRPGVYWVAAKFEDAFHRMSDSSSRLKLTVPSTSSIAAPKLKGVRVE